jgi:hypothetical protein
MWPDSLCDDRKNNVRLQTMQVVKGDQNGYPVPEDIAGPPCPGGYKYDEMFLHIRVGRQSDNLSP